ncbi:MAG TPA: antibiotic biosynthesis monooxygenase [bacterium]|nr:antibiotic biosynthesis monooxygenase [bacterium]
MSITVVNDYDFKPDGDVAEGKAAAAELVEYFTAEVPEVQLSLWLEDRDNPLHHYHITVFETLESLERVKASKAIKRFVERLFPQIAHSTYIAPVTDVWLADGSGVKAVPLS